ncbi:hypothetical protein XG88_004607 [Salmonella enterica subsp. enterica]|nr:hypothetical protein [Salmonella enterica subsp. enterica]EDW2741357.1 hypothetical protein [Salmonella enterica subsp. enterica]EDW6226467.1 hypothetical protein [Salmonella enterica subsp. enterica]
MLVTEENRAGKHEHEYDPLGNLLETQQHNGEQIFQLVEAKRGSSGSQKSFLTQKQFFLSAPAVLA